MVIDVRNVGIKLMSTPLTMPATTRHLVIHGQANCTIVMHDRGQFPCVPFDCYPTTILSTFSLLSNSWQHQPFRTSAPTYWSGRIVSNAVDALQQVQQARDSQEKTRVSSAQLTASPPSCVFLGLSSDNSTSNIPSSVFRFLLRVFCFLC